jgi:RNA polymerase sigma-70 factor (ECF subfamily)
LASIEPNHPRPGRSDAAHADDSATAAGCAEAAHDARAADLCLVERLIQRDAGAWASFVDRFQRLVLARVCVCGNELNRPLGEAEAEDLCADVFSQLIADNYAALRRFEGRSTLSTWLCVVVRRIARRRLLSMQRDPCRPDPSEVPVVNGLAGPVEDPLRRLIDGEDRTLLAAGLAQLGERQRQLVHLLYFDGCSYREVSEQLQIPMNSIGPTLQRIQQKLRAALKADD